MKQNKFYLLIFIVLFSVLAPLSASSVQKRSISNMVSLLLPNGTAIKKKIPSLAMMSAIGTDKIELAWIPGSDGITPDDKVLYNIYLSTSEDFTADMSTLKKKVVGDKQTVITGLDADTRYYGKVIAFYHDSGSRSRPSNSLATKTYKYPVKTNTTVTMVKAADLGLGEHSTVDGATYSYSGGTPPNPGSILFSEDSAGGGTLRKVDSASSSGDTVTVRTSPAYITDVIDRGAISSSFQLFDVANQAKQLSTRKNSLVTPSIKRTKDGSLHSSIHWKNGMLSAEQIDYAHDDAGILVVPEENASKITLATNKSVETDSSFTATLTTEFEPILTTEMEWGGTIIKELEYAHVAAKGTLSLTAIAQYNFSIAGSVEKEFQLYERTWRKMYAVGELPVYQEITLSVGVEVSASAVAELQAQARANLTEVVEVGARYNGSRWVPYIIHDESKSFSASLDIAGKAESEIRLVPKIDVTFYRVATGSLSVEPLIESSLNFEKTTDNLDFLAANPARLVQLTSFDASAGMEAKVAVNLSAFDHTWEVLEETCVLGTSTCIYPFDEIPLFSLPKFTVSAQKHDDTRLAVITKVEDGINNPFFLDSIRYHVYPEDAEVNDRTCSRSGSTTTCLALYTPGVEEEYTVFASGYGRLQELGRQFVEIQLDGGSGELQPPEEDPEDPVEPGDPVETCPSGSQTKVIGELEWQRCDDGNLYTWEEAKQYCAQLSLDGVGWRLPTKTELKSLVVCSNGVHTPLHDAVYPYEIPYQCGLWSFRDWRIPTMDPDFSCSTDTPIYWSSTPYEGYSEHAWGTDFATGRTHSFGMTATVQVLCVR